MLYQLSYAGLETRVRLIAMERETGIEPATNSLEGCDSTIELLPQQKHAERSYSSLPAI